MARDVPGELERYLGFKARSEIGQPARAPIAITHMGTRSSGKLG